MRKRYSPIPKPFTSPFDASADDPPPATDASFRPPRKKIAGGIRAWLLVDAAGEAQVVEAGKHSIMRRTGLPARDLRILDPLLSYPSTVLGRERAIVINLENIKAIITAQEVLLLNSRDPAVIPFVEELQRRILRLQRGTKEAQKEGSGNEAECASPSSGGEDNTKGEGRGGYENTVGSRELPFEFIALEACLEAACSCLETEARTLEQEAHPALDKLTSKISTLNLERVRQIKSRLVAITGRVQKVRDELEHLLDDDEDMAEMYLTEKMMHQKLDGSSSVSSVNEGRAFVDDGVLPPELEMIHGEISAEGNDMDTFEGDLPDTENMDGTTSVPSMLRVYSHRTRSSSTRSGSKHLDIEELEMLLEAYFVQIDGTLNKLSTLREYVDDTEDYINIMLDDKQNHLLQMGVMLTTATLVVSAFVVVAGIFGMNINIDLFDKQKAGTRDFLWTVGGGTIGSFVLYVVAIAWCKRKRLLE